MIDQVALCLLGILILGMIVLFSTNSLRIQVRKNRGRR